MNQPQKKEYRQCIRCQQMNEQTDQFCIRCGSPLINRCSDEKGLLSKGCFKENPPEAAFCRFCGQPTIFNQAGLTKPFTDS
ncbi:hypothetical protein [Paenibacillus hamazuiensis]|uniref:hypothetical protein n=1 Tax=Paenibacillus hamazuiensis TaxID=2936508 RepID=UPI00200D9449|nr:hypothetical protein [Paenibacillus hamazuiensis]